MPPVAAAVGAIAGGIGAAGSAVIGAGTSALGGIAAAGSSIIGAGTSALGGIAEATTGTISGLAELGAGTLTLLKEKKTDILGAARTGSEIYTMFQKPDQPSTGQPTKTGFDFKTIPQNILNTLPQLLRQPQQQILTTPAPTKPQAENTFIKYLPIIGLAVLGYFLLRK